MNGISEFYIFYVLLSALQFLTTFGLLLGFVSRIFYKAID